MKAGEGTFTNPFVPRSLKSVPHKSEVHRRPAERATSRICQCLFNWDKTLGSNYYQPFLDRYGMTRIPLAIEKETGALVQKDRQREPQ
jgi:hypothetical protein